MILRIERPKMYDGMPCVHEGDHCSEVSYPWPYLITRGPEILRWSTPDDPEFPCCCLCDDCKDWRQTKEEIEGPVVLPTE